MIKLLKNFKKKIDESYGRFSIVQHGFWFVDIPRTSSSSIRSELGKRFGRAYGKKNVVEKQHATSQIFSDHMTAIKMQAFIGDSNWNKLFTFTVVRNPWDRTFSMYHYRKKKDDIPREWNFRDYVFELAKATSKCKYFGYYAYRVGASDYVLGENGEIIIDFIARYENRLHDLKEIASRLNLNEFGELRIQSSKPREAHYSEFYDSETQEIVRQLYYRDIELFNYEF